MAAFYNLVPQPVIASRERIESGVRGIRQTTTRILRRVNVIGVRLGLAPSLVSQLEAMECGLHDDLSTVDLIVSQDGGDVSGRLDITCCEEFRAATRAVLDDHNERHRQT